MTTNQETADQPKRKWPTFYRDMSIDDTPLEPKELARIWANLPEQSRYRFLLAIREDLADKLIELTTPRQLQKIMAEERTTR